MPGNEILFPAQFQSLLHSHRLAVFESQRENDCVTKYLLDEYEDSTGQQYAIGTTQLMFYPKLLSSLYLGLTVDETYKGVYLWDANGDLDDIVSTMAFQNWASSKTISDV